MGGGGGGIKEASRQTKSRYAGRQLLVGVVRPVNQSGRQVDSCLLVLYAQSTSQADSLFVGCLTSQQHASVSQGRFCSDKFTCCHTEIEVADQTFYLTQSQYTDTGMTSPSTDPITPGTWQGRHWSANF